MAKLSEALVCGAKDPGIDSRHRQSCFFRKMVIARKVAEKREGGMGREKSKEERTVKERRNFFL